MTTVTEYHESAGLAIANAILADDSVAAQVALQCAAIYAELAKTAVGDEGTGTSHEVGVWPDNKGATGRFADDNKVEAIFRAAGVLPHLTDEIVSALNDADIWIIEAGL